MMRLDPGGGDDDTKDGWGVLLRVTCESCWMRAKGLLLCVGIIIVNALSGGLFIRVCDVFIFFLFLIHVLNKGFLTTDIE